MRHKLEIRNSVRDETAQKVLGSRFGVRLSWQKGQVYKIQNCHVKAHRCTQMYRNGCLLQADGGWRKRKHTHTPFGRSEVFPITECGINFRGNVYVGLSPVKGRNIDKRARQNILAEEGICQLVSGGTNLIGSQSTVFRSVFCFLSTEIQTLIL